ncbi:MAG: tetratricopeptide repeat protein [Promethearchaeota archaeon]
MNENLGYFLPRMATIYRNLGNIYVELYKIEDAKNAYNEAIDIYKRLSTKFPKIYTPYLKTTQTIIENLSSKVKRVQD